MRALQRDAGQFAAYKQKSAKEAGQRVALRLLCGLDLEELTACSASERIKLVERLDRLLKRERLKGLKKHWSYDLNRHIALKQARDRLRALKPVSQTGNQLPE
ncbi:cytoplasmic protein [Aquamicrobium segne]|uniref:Cytoplasmic protein n=1 Tax=Aquamicrobium segne TaxID=469547 RepID=A0ABW0GUY7_9HYPH